MKTMKQREERENVVKPYPKLFNPLLKYGIEYSTTISLLRYPLKVTGLTSRG